MTKEKILFLGDHPAISLGYASTTRWFAKQFMKIGYDVYTIAFNTWDHFSEEIYDGIKVIPNQYHTSSGLNDNYGNEKLISDYDRVYNFSAIIAHNDCYRFKYFNQLKDSILRKVSFWVPFDQPRGSVDNWIPSFVLPLIRRGARCYFISETGYDAHKHIVPENLSNRMGFIRHSVELDHYYPLSEEECRIAREKKSCTHNFVVIRVDRNQPRKNWRSTLESFALFSVDKPEAILIAKTNPTDITAKENLNDVVRELGIEKKVIFTDKFYSNESMRNELYGISNVFLSTSCGEGYGLSIAEASVCGKPVIATGETAIPEVIGNGGLLIDVEKIEAIDPPFNEVKYCYVDKQDAVKKLNLLYDDWKSGGKLLKQLSENGVKHVRKICDTKTIINQWQEKIEATIKENNPLVLISLVTFNSVDYIETCLRSLWQYTLYQNYKIVIYDNASTDGTVEVLKMLQEEDDGKTILDIYFSESNDGFGVGCNYGASLAKNDDLILFLNPDTKILPTDNRDYIQILKEKLDDDKNVAVCGPAGDIFIYDSAIDHIQFVGGWCMLVKASAFKDDRVGGFDEAYTPAYFEDIDLCVKFYQAGYTKASAGETNYPVWHKNQHTRKDDETFNKLWNKSRNYFLNKWRDYIKELKPVTVSVIIAYYNKPQILDLALNGYTKQTKQDFEIIIADDGSTDEVLDVMKKYEDKLNIKRVWHEDEGFRKCKILNIAVNKAKSDCLIFADGDTIPCNDLVKLHYEAYVAYGNNIIVVGLRNDISSDILDNSQDDPASEKYFVDLDWRYKNQRGILETIEFHGLACNVVYGCNFSVSKWLWSEIGGFDESFVSPGTGEDTDFALRASMIGCHFGYLEKALVYHIAHERQDCSISQCRMYEVFERESFIIRCPFRWRNVWVVGVYDLIRILGISLNEAMRRSETKYGAELLAEEWKQINPITQEQRDNFYKTTSSYIYDLSYYNALPDIVQKYNDICNLCRDKKVLDFGAGIGTLTMLLAKSGIDVSYYDLSGKTSEYAQKRFEIHGIKPRIYLDNIDSIEGKFDIIVANDVFEHLENPISYVEKLSNMLNDGGYFFMQNAFFVDENYPMHLKETALQADTFYFDLRKLGLNKVSNVLYQKKEIVKITLESKVTVEISTKDRQPYLATLLVSLINQTFTNWELLVTDNGSDMTMVENEQIMKLFNMIGKLGHRWRCNKVPSEGLLTSRRIALQNIDTPLTLRIDDDLILQPDFLQVLFDNFILDPNLGAVGGLYLFADNPTSMLQIGYENDPNCQGRIDHLDWSLQIHRHPDDKVKNVDHLTSSFLHRTDLAKACGCYGLNLSQIAFREDTECSFRIKLSGHSVKIDPRAIAYHFAAKNGGCSVDPEIKRQMVIVDDKIFQEWLRSVRGSKKMNFNSMTELCSYFVDKNKVNTYLEIGVEYSKILPNLKVKRKIGVDPIPQISPDDCLLIKKLSDDFFLQDAPELFKDEPIGLAFIDGLHWCEFVLRDFMNCEKYAKKDSVIILHDCIPSSEETQTREIKYRNEWHGDCWRALYYILENRSDLDVTVWREHGAAVIRNLNPDYKWFDINFDDVKNKYDYLRDFPYLMKKIVDFVE